MKKSKENVRLIIDYSNASLIKSKTDKGYTCYACPQLFQDPRALKAHFLEKHSTDIHKIQLHTKYRILKLDITDLKCILCDEDFDNLEQGWPIDFSDKRTSKRRHQETPEKITLDKKINFSTFINIKPANATKSKTQRTEKSPSKSPPVKEIPKPVAKPRRTPRARPPDKVIQRRLTELDLHYDNIRTVLRCSNATPIRSKVGDRYSCGYCLDQFADPRELKAHTLDIHSDTDDKPECLCIRSLSKYCVHLDVTDLKCEVCEASMDKLEDLIDHLKLEHDELIHTNIRNLMVPYKFESKEVNCVCCLKQFDDYNELQDHMSEHYKNYVCEFCDKAFLLRNTMIEHKKVVHRV